MTSTPGAGMGDLPDDVVGLIARAAGPVATMGVCRRWYVISHAQGVGVARTAAVRGGRFVIARIEACCCVAALVAQLALAMTLAVPALCLRGAAAFVLCTMAHCAAVALSASSRPRLAVHGGVLASVVAFAAAPDPDPGDAAAPMRMAACLVCAALVRALLAGLLGYSSETAVVVVVVETLRVISNPDARWAVALTSWVACVVQCAVLEPPSVAGCRPAWIERALSSWLFRCCVTRRALIAAIALPRTLGRVVM